ncbi:MAG: CtsR family transcriptional regulator [Monoglobales bacterium]
MNISDIIEAFIHEKLKDANGKAEIRRNELAEHLGCVPSQINYVISTRFTTERGYTVESRRGGGGYISIKRVVYPTDNTIMHVVNSIGDDIDFASAKAILRNLWEYDVISRREAEIMISVLSDRVLTLPRDQRGVLRARLLKNMLMQLT